jgi:hypothetical protein
MTTPSREVKVFLPKQIALVKRFLEEAQKEQEDIPPQKMILESKKADL